MCQISEEKANSYAGAEAERDVKRSPMCSRQKVSNCLIPVRCQVGIYELVCRAPESFIFLSPLYSGWELKYIVEIPVSSPSHTF